MMTGGFAEYPNGAIKVENVTVSLAEDGEYEVGCAIVFYSDNGITEVKRDQRNWRTNTNPGTEIAIAEICEQNLLLLPEYEHMSR